MIFNFAELYAEMKRHKIYHLELKWVRGRWQVELKWYQTTRNLYGIGDTPAQAINLALERAREKMQELPGRLKS